MEINPVLKPQQLQSSTSSPPMLNCHLISYPLIPPTYQPIHPSLLPSCSNLHFLNPPTMAAASCIVIPSQFVLSASVFKQNIGLRAAGFQPNKNRRLVVRASAVGMKEKAVSVATAVAMAAALVLPEVADAAGPGISPSLKNFLLSIGAGGVVPTVIIGAVVGVSNFDPVKRG